MNNAIYREKKNLAMGSKIYLSFATRNGPKSISPILYAEYGSFLGMRRPRVVLLEG